MLDYDEQAAAYDETRGGEPRAREAAAAVARLAPHAAVTVDLAGGTGIVSALLPGRSVLVVDLSHGMLRRAHARVPGHAVRGDVRRLPVRDGCADLVTAVWVLHLLDDAAPVLDEVARVLQPGGLFVTTVDKDDAHGHPRSGAATDATATVTALAAARGLVPDGGTTFAGRGQRRPDGGEPTYRVLALRRPAPA